MTFLPIVERELRVAARQPSTSLLRFLVALVGVILWLGLIGARSGRAAPANIGETLFYALTFLLFVCCLSAGMFLTADCLSVEKREGTLGLLFLTDLKGYDIVLGKLFSTSLRSSYALVAGFPVLALPLLIGGVTVGEFWRVVLTLLATLFLSLTCGLFMSAVMRQSRSGLGGTFLFLQQCFQRSVPARQETFRIFGVVMGGLALSKPLACFYRRNVGCPVGQ